jgi:geranylgeranyl diphosphate synthase type I
MAISLQQYMQDMRPSIEEELQLTLNHLFSGDCEELKTMMAYHMGWEGPGEGEDAQGKRIRPILLLLCTEAAGASWRGGLPAAAAVEYLHNFSLIHDDIQDQSPLRRGRETIWKRWGVAQAVNTGDFMFTMAHLAILKTGTLISEGIALRASQILHHTSIQLTKGQYLDMSYEAQRSVPLENYWPMISGKTAALIGCCTEVGALMGGADEPTLRAYREFGTLLGLAFQVQDDWLGIWGDTALTGKSIESDLVTGKKTLPILFSLSLKGKFFKRWHCGPIQAEEVTDLAKLLSEEGAKDYVEKKSIELTNKALANIEINAINGGAKNALCEMAISLTTRQQ